MSNRSAVSFIAIGRVSRSDPRLPAKRALHASSETGACAPHPIDLPWYLPGMDFSA